MDVGFYGNGMICRDQLGPAFAQLRRLGLIGQIFLSGRSAKSISRLIESERMAVHFPEFGPSSYRTFPSLDSTETFEPFSSYIRMLEAMKPGDLIVIATPDQFHTKAILEAVECGFHVICVKSLCTNYADAVAIETRAREKGLFVGIDYHKMFDSRVRQAVGWWRSGKFGEFRMGRATMIEDHSYLSSGFAAHFDPASSDPVTYVGCHYLQQLYAYTGLRPVSVSALGYLGKFRNDAPAYTWGCAQFEMEEGGGFQLINGLQFAGKHPARNHQGIEIFGADPVTGDGTYLQHVDNGRGMTYVYSSSALSSDAKFADQGSDYVGFFPLPGGKPGSQLYGYGYDAILEMTLAAQSIQASANLPARQALLAEFNNGYIPTPANTAWLGLVYQAVRLSVESGARLVDMNYGEGRVSLR